MEEGRAGPFIHKMTFSLQAGDFDPVSRSIALDNVALPHKSGGRITSQNGGSLQGTSSFSTPFLKLNFIFMALRSQFKSTLKSIQFLSSLWVSRLTYKAIHCLYISQNPPLSQT
jgi:hypothetical protein